MIYRGIFMKNAKRLIGILFAGIVLAGGLFAQKTGATTVKVGVCGSSNDQWKVVQYLLDQESLPVLHFYP